MWRFLWSLCFLMVIGEIREAWGQSATPGIPSSGAEVEGDLANHSISQTSNFPCYLPCSSLSETAPQEKSPSSKENDTKETDFSQFAWKKGDYKIVPYGIGWLTMSFDTVRTQPGSFVLFVESPDLQGEPQFNLDARSSRLGLDVIGPKILTLPTFGRIELDFQGSALVENRATVLLRHAYGEFKNDKWRFLGGQTWDIISPLNPNQLNYSVAWSAGNIGFRRAQLRVERYISLSDKGLVTLQASLNREFAVDFLGTPGLVGEDAGWPEFQGRMALALGSDNQNKRPIEIGISGHIGQEGVDFLIPPRQDDARFLTWSFNTDVRLNIDKAWGFQGEFFFGENLATFLGGINQGIDPVTRVGIGTIGGWVEGYTYLSDQVHCHVGYGIDDPQDTDLSFGGRASNQMIFGNVIWDVTELFTVGVELSYWKTRYIGLSEGETFRVETVVLYRF